MITCPNCAHNNPDSAVYCEACYTPLPALINCPSCGFSLAATADFCSQCGFALSPPPAASPPKSSSGSAITATAIATPGTVPVAAKPVAATQLQQQTAKLLHIRSSTSLELPAHLDLVHIGKPNDRIPPDIDVSGFPDADIVSRVHADIRVEGDSYFLEDVGSSNGTYVNNFPLRPGDRHRLRPGDRIALGKGDKVSFLFQIS